MSTKDAVLAALMQAKGALSGEQLAQALGLSRNSVWKAVDQLRQEGYAISAGTNRGYRLMQAPRHVTETGIRAQLGQHSLGCRMEVYDEIDSTNRRAREWAMAGAPEGALVIAREQTAGRGRFDRRFVSPRDAGVYMSLILRPRWPAERSVLITSMTAVAVARAVEKLSGAEAQIKWVNDVVLNGKKVCGILCEAGLNFESGAMDHVVVGIGINVARQTFPPELEAIATSLGNVAPAPVDANILVAEVLDQMAELYRRLDPAEFMAEYRARSNVLGRLVTVMRGDERFEAVAEAIDDEGGLLVRAGAGLVRLQSGEISIKLEDRG